VCAKHFILIAKTSDDPRKGLTAFLFDAGQPGWRVVRRIPIMGPEEQAGHCELEFDGLEIDDANRLMGVGDGLKVTQTRLGAARLTHCMRWLGLRVARSTSRPTTSRSAKAAAPARRARVGADEARTLRDAGRDRAAPHDESRHAPRQG
jgi:hypothetical protein